MSNQQFDFSVDGKAPGGWRLNRLEMANWGTFGEGHVHSLVADENWTLLVGENGSGKSTAIDALRTLLAPRSVLQHSFNDAAGGQKKRDRTLTTYIRGAWSTRRDDDDIQTEIKFLRKEGIPSYLLAVFHNARLQATITLAQILWVANGKDETVYLVGNNEYCITDHLQGLETGRGMKKDLMQRGFDVRDTYKAYREDFCTRMGIPGESALEIFNQAIGVKEVAEVSVFLRRNLLVSGETPDFIQKQVIPRFSDLESCWTDIERAEKQIAVLQPVAEAFAEVEETKAKRSDIIRLQEALPHYYLRRHAELLRLYLDRCALELSAAKTAYDDLDVHRGEAQSKRDLLKAQYDADETSRLIKEIDLEMGTIQHRISQRRQNHQQLDSLLRAEHLGSVPSNESAFLSMRSQLAARLVELKEWEEKSSDRANKQGVKTKQLEVEIEGVKEELDSLQGRQALIPAYLQYIRNALCDATGVSVEDLPFAGELLEIKPEYAEDWSGVIERLLHNFGVSLLVPERHYPSVARWVNGRHLKNAAGDGIRLQFHRITANDHRTVNVFNPRMVSGRLNFRDEHPLARWVAVEAQGSFPHVCCLNTVDLENERFGVTKEGLIRNGTRHVKDDRRALGSRRDYVLGWSPERKIHFLNQQLAEDTQALANARSAEKAARNEASIFRQRTQKIEIAQEMHGFVEIDFSSEQAQLADLANQKAELEKSSDKRDTLKHQLKEAEELLTKLLTEREEIATTIRLKKDEREKLLPNLDKLDTQLAHEIPRDFTEMATAYIEAEDGTELTHLNIGETRERVDKTLRGRASNLTAKINDAEKKMIAPMQKFLNDYPNEVKDLQAKSDYAQEFVNLHDQLVREDLPRHKERFRDFLNTNLTESIGGLEAMLDAEVKSHRERVDQVNDALRNLDYGDGTFVEIVRRDTRDVGIRDFKAKLRDCLSAGLNPDENQRLELYKKIREIVTRFSKEPEWMARVADSRLWLEFSVNERRKLDGMVINTVDSSTGKSGGQKAKMAFTILAASLLAQYGLADDPDRADSLRLVMVDEVFARTDAPNSQRALELFQSLGFQLLLAAPWKAEARIAERFVESFHLTVNPNGDASRIRRATRAQYEATRKKQSPAHV
jgi:uncharacterized protein YPO0396